MEYNIKTKRNKKSDKAKIKYEITGKFSKKYIRIMEKKKDNSKLSREFNNFKTKI